MNSTRVQYPIYKACIECGKQYPCYKKQQFEKRKYCSTDCMYSSNEYIESRNKGAKSAAQKSTAWMKNPELHRRAVEAARRTKVEKYGAFSDRRVRMKNGDILNITNGELDKYRDTQTRCEICGKEEKISSGKTAQPNKLSVDHNHETLLFRGLLCCDCNRKLGWYENLKDNIEAYMLR